MKSKIIEGPELKGVYDHRCVGRFFFDHGRRNGDKISQIDATRNLSETYSSVVQRSVRVALEMKKRGVTSNDVIAQCASNSLDTVIPILAGFYLGAKVTNFDPLLSLREKKHLVSLVRPRMVFVDQATEEALEECLKAHGVDAEIVVYGGSKRNSSFGEFTKAVDGEEEFYPEDMDLDDTIYIMYSSGSTGLSKAILMSHRGYLNFGCNVTELNVNWSTILHSTTFYWTAANFSNMICFLKGGQRVFFVKFDPAKFLKTIQDYKVTFASVVGSYTYDILSVPGANQYDLSSLHTLSLAGSPVAPMQLKKTHALFKHSTVMVNYGMTETGCLTVFDPIEDKELITKNLTSVGKVGPTASIKIVDVKTGQLLGPNEQGEVRAKTKAMMKGYKDIDNSQVFDEDGFLKTGDVGYYDEDGCVYIVDRLKEMFKHKIWHIVPSALEAVILQHPSVKEAGVFGIPHEEFENLPAAAVTLKEGASATPEEIADFVKERSADWEQLKGGVFIVDQLPRTPSGKVTRRRLVELFAVRA